ncbi:MAG: M14 family zinc carboxypeptidase [Anaerolineales bacterium]
MTGARTPPSSNRLLSRFVGAFWVINTVCALFVAAAWLMSKYPVKAFFISPTPTATMTLTATYTPLPSPTSTPTLTATLTITPTASISPTASPSSTPSQTPRPYSEGPIVIGQSVQGRPLEVYRFGTGPNEKMIIGGMHGGDEYNTVELADQLIAYLKDHPEIVPADATVYILHDLNPDGVALQHGPNGRANADGVDLNRNWPVNWQKDWPREGCWVATKVTGGPAPASEPETKALTAFIVNHPITAILNYHSAELGIFPGGVPPAENSKELAAAIAAVTHYPYPPINTGCDYTGGFVDWAASRGIPALDIELTNHTDTDFDVNLLALQVLLNWKN